MPIQKLRDGVLKILGDSDGDVRRQPSYGRCRADGSDGSHRVVHFASHGNVSGEWDADRLAQVVTNLIGNAIQHGGTGLVTLHVNDAGDHVTLSVHNAGDPIPSEAQQTIFEPLARGSADGTQRIGLGLFIATAIVVAHGGDISVTSSRDSRTTFAVILPKRSSQPGGQNPQLP